MVEFCAGDDESKIGTDARGWSQVQAELVLAV